jgi:RNA polymerase sigma-70 factor, ECF subfamily
VDFLTETPSPRHCLLMGETRSAAAESPSTADARGVPPFSVVYERHFDLVWAAARQLGVEPAAMDDVVQEVFVVIHARLGSLQQAELLRSWVYGVARRVISGYRRAQRSRVASGDRYAELVDWIEPMQQTPQELTELAERQRLLLRILSDVDSAKREVFVLAEIEGFTAPEIAEALELPLNTVYSRLRLARQAFQQAMARHVAPQKGSD